MIRVSPAVAMLTRLTNARNAVEVGTFTGYSAVCIARALQPGGRLLCEAMGWSLTASSADKNPGTVSRNVAVIQVNQEKWELNPVV